MLPMARSCPFANHHMIQWLHNTSDEHDDGLGRAGQVSVPTILLDHVGQLNNELPFLVLLAWFKCMLLKKQLNVFN